MTSKHLFRIGLQIGGKVPINVWKLSKNSRKIPKNPGKFPKFLECLRNLLEIFHLFATLIWNIYIIIFLHSYFFNLINVFTITFDQFNATMLNKSIHFLKKKKKNLTDIPQILNSSLNFYTFILIGQ